LTDTVTKRAVYAEWGIPVYVVIDPVARTSVWHGDLTDVEWAKDALSAVLPPA
jgi:Uma2 family endonuclease